MTLGQRRPNAVIIGFNVRANQPGPRPSARAGLVSKSATTTIIYNLVDDIKAMHVGHAVAGDAAKRFLGNAEILEVFKVSKVGKVAGCRVTEGMVERGAKRPAHPRQGGDPRRQRWRR